VLKWLSWDVRSSYKDAKCHLKVDQARGGDSQ
jgi:hypothetical protein